MSNLNQWVMFKGKDIKSWFVGAEISEIALSPAAILEMPKQIVQYGPSLQVNGFVFPLSFCAPKEQLFRLKQDTSIFNNIVPQNTLRVQMEFNASPEMDSKKKVLAEPSLKSLSLLGEMVSQIQEVVNLLELHFLTFSNHLSDDKAFVLTMNVPAKLTVLKAFRAITLLQASVEIMCFYRGFELSSFQLDLGGVSRQSLSETLVDDWQTLLAGK